MDTIGNLVESIKRHPDNVGTRVRLIKLFSQKGKKERATHLYHLTIARPKITVQERIELGKIAQSLGLLNEAETQLKTAVQHAPDNVIGLTGLA